MQSSNVTSYREDQKYNKSMEKIVFKPRYYVIVYRSAVTNSVIYLKCILVLCYGYDIDFNSRPRNFSVELIHHIKLNHFVISPYCVWSVIKAASLGAYEDTQKQMLHPLRLNPKNNKHDVTHAYENWTNSLFEAKHDGVNLASSTLIFYNSDINVLPSYKASLNRLHVSSKILDFQDTKQAAQVAIAYVHNIANSQYSISNIFHAEDFVEASVILSNVIYFKGIFSTPFNASLTIEETIYNENNIAIGNTTMMHRKGKLAYSNFETMNSHILELPFGDDGKLCMLVILPYPGINFRDVYKKLEIISLKDILIKLEKDVNEFGLRDIDVKLPRFNIRTSVYLNEALNNMGIYDAFEPEIGKFNGITDNSLYISTVEHKAEIVFTETETVVIATIPGYFDKSISPSYVKANQPFIFFLIEKPTASVIFGGIYSKHRL